MEPMKEKRHSALSLTIFVGISAHQLKTRTAFKFHNYIRKRILGFLAICQENLPSFAKTTCLRTSIYFNFQQMLVQHAICRRQILVRIFNTAAPLPPFPATVRCNPKNAKSAKDMLVRYFKQSKISSVHLFLML